MLNINSCFFPCLRFRYIKAALLPMQPPVNHMCCTKPVVDLRKPTFGETFPIAVPLNKLYTKTLQVNVWCTGNESEECLVRASSGSFLFLSFEYQDGNKVLKSLNACLTHDKILISYQFIDNSMAFIMTLNAAIINKI